MSSLKKVCHVHYDNIYNLTNLEINRTCIRTCPPVNFPGLNVTTN